MCKGLNIKSKLFNERVGIGAISEVLKMALVKARHGPFENKK